MCLGSLIFMKEIACAVLIKTHSMELVSHVHAMQIAPLTLTVPVTAIDALRHF